MSQKHFLEDIIEGELHDDKQTLDIYSTDASIFRVQPDTVVFPKNLNDVKNIVKQVSDLKQQGEPVSVTPRAAGTCMSGGSLTNSIMLDMTKYFHGVGEVDVHHKLISVGSGAYYRDVEKALLPKQLLFPPYTSSKDLCAIGGMIGNNASGEKSLRYGATVNWVHSIHIVLSDGEEYQFGPLSISELDDKKRLDTFEGHIYREIDSLLTENTNVINQARPTVRKNAAGYGLWHIWNKDRTEFNLAKLFVGAQGTLGILSGATLSVIDNPKSTRMIVIAIDSLSHLAEAIKIILAERPEGLEVYDKHTYELAKIYMPDDAARTTMSEGNQMVLFAQFAEPSEDQTNHNAKVCLEVLKKHKFVGKYIEDADEAESYWKIRRASFKLLKEHAHGTKRAAPFIEDTIINTAHYGEFVASLEAILADYDMTYTYAGHIGDGSIRLIPLVDMESDGAAEKIFDLGRRIYELTFAFGGSMSVDHNDGLIRTPFLGHMYGQDVVALFEKTKQIFDPLNIFNPGKKVHGDLRYSIEHVNRTNNPVA